jgi:23S rRNA (adenine2503-C2)-methyltransferase
MVFKHLIDDWSDATTLPRALRDRLQCECLLSIRADVFEHDGGASAKALLRLRDGSQVEAVLMRHADQRNTVCVSSQVGCPAGCTFCATGALGFTRNLEAMEIVEQVLLFARWLRRRGSGVTNVVFMGMGEPLWNYENVVQAIATLNDRRGLGIGSSVVMLTPR